MRNLKKLLAVIVAVTTILTFAIPAFAADAAPAAAASKIASDLGVLKGDTADGVTAAYLAKGTTRLQAAILQLRLLGKEAEAYAETSTDNFADANLVTWADGAALLAYLKKNPDLGWVGTDGKFDPNGACTAQMLYKVLLESLGYKTGTDFQYADAIKFAGTKGLTGLAALTNLTNDNVATGLVEALKAKTSDGAKTLAQKLVDNNIITDAAAVTAGLVVGAKALDLSGAVALNSKVVEVTLGTAAIAKDLAAAGALTVKDSAAKAVAVSKIDFAPWATSGKDLLVTLAADSTAGTVYTITCGTKTANFGGIAVDSTKPTVTKVESTDYNQAKITFSEPILLGGTVAFAKSYGDKAALASTTITYNDSSSIFVATADQAAATLYAATIKAYKDLAGNTMDDDTAKTFVGTPKSTDNLKTDSAWSNNADEASVKLTLKVDTATIAPANFKVVEAYGSAPATMTVAAARIATTDDKANDNATALSSADAAKTVILTVTGLKASTLYKVTVSNLKSYVGTAMDSTTNNVTFVGTAKPTSAFKYNGVPTATSNTTITVAFPNYLDKATAETVANYAIVEAYGTSPATLAVSKAALQSDNKTVKLTVAVMKNIMYKLTATGLKDIYGNAIDTSSSNNVTTFVGAGVEDKISGINGYTRDSDTQITVEFNHKVGASANDISHYSIDNSVGYPSKAAAVTDTTVANYANKVALTIPKTSDGKVYTVTVKGLENADGVAEDSANFTFTFVGRGLNATLPTVSGAFSTDKQTVKVYFDRDATDASLDGKVWSSSSHTLVAGAIYADYAGTGYVDLSTRTEYVWQDATDKTAINIRIDDGDVANIFSGTTSMNFKFINAKFDGDADVIIPVAKTTTAITLPQISGAYCEDQDNLVVIFNTPIATPAGTVAQAFVTDDVSGAPAATSTGVTKIDSMTYRFSFTTDLTPALAGSDSQFYVRINKASVTDISGFFGMKGDSDDSLAYGKIIFGASGTKKNYIDGGIYAMCPDDRTIEVYYPEAMKAIKYATDTASARDGANYHLYKNDGTTAVVGVTINSVNYDSTLNKATLYLSAVLPTADNMYKLAIDNTVANANGTKLVKKSDGTAIDKIQFARSATAHTAPAISAISVGTDGQSISVTFDRDVAFGATLNGTMEVNDGTDNGANTNVGADQFVGDVYTDVNDLLVKSSIPAGNVDDYFVIKATFDGGSEVTVADGDVASTVRDSNSKITINFNKKLKANTSGSVKTKTGAAAFFIDKTGTACKVTSGDESSATFGVAATYLLDTTGPTLLGAKLMDEYVGDPLAATPTKGHDGKVDSVVLTFSENVQTIDVANLAIVLRDAAGAYTNPGTGNVTVATADKSVSVTDNVATVLFRGATIANTGLSTNSDLTLTIADGYVKDLAGNELLKDDGTALSAGYLVTSKTNQADDAATTLLADKAGPVLVSVVHSAGTNAVFGDEDNDVLTFTFSELVNEGAAAVLTDNAPTAAEINALFTFGAGALTALTVDTGILNGTTATLVLTENGATAVVAPDMDSANAAHNVTTKAMTATTGIVDTAGNVLVGGTVVDIT